MEETKSISNKRLRSWINLASKIKKDEASTNMEWRQAGIILALIAHLRQVKRENKVNA